MEVFNVYRKCTGTVKSWAFFCLLFPLGRLKLASNGETWPIGVVKERFFVVVVAGAIILFSFEILCRYGIVPPPTPPSAEKFQ